MVTTMIPADSLAEYLCRSWEGIDESERNATMPDTSVAAGIALVTAIKDRWKPRSDKSLAAKADIDPSTLSGLKKGFDEESNSAFKVCEALGIDFKAACKGKVKDANPDSVPPAARPVPAKVEKPTLAAMASEFDGTKDEDDIRKFLEYKRSSRGNR